ncbi:13212_t:CDS:2, partial [Racocetra fulgida]
QDIDRMQLEHFLFQHIWKCDFSSPIEQILKAGDAKFYGIDIAPVFPKEIKPENLEFIQSDITHGIRFDDNHFDFVRMNLMSTCLPEDQWVHVIEELVRVLKPDGYIEIMEPEFQFYNIGPYFSKLNSCAVHGGKIGKIYAELLGMYFENTVVDVLPWYMGMSRENYLD